MSVPRCQSDTVRIPVLLLVGDEGQLATLTLEAVGGGAGELYPAPDNLVDLDDAFRDALQAARISVDHLWPMATQRWGDFDVRWSVIPRDEQTTFPSLTGGSMGAAFAAGLELLLSQSVPAEVPCHVAITAAVDESGTLSPVASIWKKLSAAAEGAGPLGRMTHAIVAQGQEPPESTGPLTVVEVATAHEAFTTYLRLTRTWSVLTDEACRRYADIRLLLTDGPVALPASVCYQELEFEEEVEASESDTAHEMAGEDSRLPEESTPAESGETEAAGSEQERPALRRIGAHDLFGDQHRRWLIWGDPGSGKTTLCEQTARLCASGETPWDTDIFWVVLI